MFRKFRVIAAIILGISSLSVPTRAQSAADIEAIKQTASDYLEGYYQGDAARMERAVHPDLAKRIISKNPQTGRDRVDEMSALRLVQLARDGGGTKIPKETQQRDITILDVYEDMASVKIVWSGWVDYVHMTRFNGRWVIINVLWELKPKTDQKPTP